MISLNTLCPFTMIPIDEAARGEHCLHLQCFDLNTFIHMNAKHKRWQCPICNRRSLNFSRDMFYQQVLKSLVEIQEKDPAVEDKFCIDNSLGLIVNKNKRKIQDRYKIIEQDGCCKGFEIDQLNYQDGCQPKAAEQPEQRLPTPTTNATTACENPSANASPVTGEAVPPTDVGQKRTFPEANNQSTDAVQINGVEPGKKPRVASNMHEPIALD